MDSIFWDFRRVLNCEFIRRKSLNSRYSLRSFARFLGVESAYLSRVLRGQRPVTSEFIRQTCLKLKLRDEDRDRFINTHDTQKALKQSEQCVTIYDGRVLRLLGTAPLAQANAYLAPRGVRAVDFGGHALISVSTNEYTLTTEGPYNESFMCLLAQPLKSDALGFYFECALISNALVAKKYERILSVREQPGDMAIQTDAAGFPCRMEAFLTGKGEKPSEPVYRGTLAVAAPSEFMPTLEFSMATAFWSGGKDNALGSYKILVDNILKKRAFNPARDAFELREGTELEQVLGAMGGFTPVEWQWLERYKAIVFESDRKSAR